jgi:hypothetical protein
MITADEQDEREPPAYLHEVADVVEAGIEQLVEVIKKLDLKVSVNVPPVDQKAPVIELTAERPEIHMPEPQPHPFRNGLTCEVVSRDVNGNIKQFTIKPISS